MKTWLFRAVATPAKLSKSVPSGEAGPEPSLLRTLLLDQRYWSAVPPPGNRSAPMFAAWRSGSDCGVSKLQSQAAVFRPKTRPSTVRTAADASTVTLTWAAAVEAASAARIEAAARERMGRRTTGGDGASRRLVPPGDRLGFCHVRAMRVNSRRDRALGLRVHCGGA